MAGTSRPSPSATGASLRPHGRDGRGPDGSGNGKWVAAMLLAIALIPLVALALLYPEVAALPVGAFLLTGVGVFIARRRQNRRR